MHKNKIIYISHRGNLNEIIKNEENDPKKILFCISEGFDVEIDVWLIGDKFYLGHDEPQYKVSFDFLSNKKLWCHAKNKEALHTMLSDKQIHCFWHQNDDYTITSHGNIWVFPGKNLIHKSIAVMPEITNYADIDLKNCFAICTDKPYFYRNLFGF
jgi:hypothetical protein